jgi:alpha-galactosidase
MYVQFPDMIPKVHLRDLGLIRTNQTVADINIDDCWSTKNRDSRGQLVPDPAKWPSGIKAVTDQIHGMGLKFGLYGCAGQMTCAGFPGSEGREKSDVAQLTSWGVDLW